MLVSVNDGNSVFFKIFTKYNIKIVLFYILPPPPPQLSRKTFNL